MLRGVPLRICQLAQVCLLCLQRHSNYYLPSLGRVARSGSFPGADLTVTDEVMVEVAEWQVRPLDALYPIVNVDALRLKIRDEGTVKTKAVYLALSIDATGRKDVLGLWIEQTEGAKSVQ